ncbi:hypothetical protein [Alteraurantiacibacter aquimixticola]|uniref:Uncharacterized protein n=1 Tax=Alteraurantiacibacter aquimixticola TaxID=2489173 RepID=A0A4T3EZ32_9SPHN|nr:hypothetical protein [Alteraurantiacibacter aquimixticola]TIX49989.1 hypothetical protein E5222_06715 [Alteraurantiacibacter aquimixticola]
MRRVFALCAALTVALPVAGPGTGLSPAPAHAQGNDNDYTPLNSRIRRDRQFPTEPRNAFAPARLTEVTRSRSEKMDDQFARCLWDRSNEKGLDLLSRTDFGFVRFEQIGIETSEIRDLYPIQTCLRRVANSHRSGVRLSYNGDSMRRWYIQAAYLDMYDDGPSWLQPGYEVAEREYPLSALIMPVRVAMDVADCVVVQDPHTVDYFYRTGEGSEEEATAIQELVPLIGSCIPEGQQIEMSAQSLRIWMGEGLWHAANNSTPPAEDLPEETE